MDARWKSKILSLFPGIETAVDDDLQAFQLVNKLLGIRSCLSYLGACRSSTLIDCADVVRNDIPQNHVGPQEARFGERVRHVMRCRIIIVLRDNPSPDSYRPRRHLKEQYFRENAPVFWINARHEQTLGSKAAHKIHQ